MGLPRNNLGSCSDDFKLGSVEGSYKTVVKDRGGVVETLTGDSRRDLSVEAYGIVEKLDKELPSGRGLFRSPYATGTPAPGIQVTSQPS
jgi:hypothetical protein